MSPSDKQPFPSPIRSHSALMRASEATGFVGVDVGSRADVAIPHDAPDILVPDYLRRVYTWAYVHRWAPKVLDRPWVVSAILWGNDRGLIDAALSELRPGQRVLQPACVYGRLSAEIAALLGPRGHLDVCDVVPAQIENCARKLDRFDNVTQSLRDAATPVGIEYDVACCFFLLHEIPEDYKRRVVGALLDAVVPGGKAVFVDYHQCHPLHPLRPVMSLVFDFLEPFAKGLCRHEVSDYAARAEDFVWSTETYFGGLYQKTVARRQDQAERVAGSST